MSGPKLVIHHCEHELRLLLELVVLQRSLAAAATGIHLLCELIGLGIRKKYQVCGVHLTVCKHLLITGQPVSAYMYVEEQAGQGLRTMLKYVSAEDMGQGDMGWAHAEVEAYMVSSHTRYYPLAEKQPAQSYMHSHAATMH